MQHKSMGFLKALLGLTILVSSSGLKGQLIYQKTFGGPQDEVFNSIRITPDTGFVISGNIRSVPSAGERDMLLVKTDGAGTVNFSRTLGNNSRDLGWDAIPTSDGGYLMTGVNLLSGSSDRAAFVKYDANGNQSWVRYQSGAIDDETFKVLEVPGLGYVFGGFSQSYTPAVDVQVSMFVTDLNGNLLLGNHYGDGGNNYAYDFIQTSDGGFAFVGRTDWGAGGWDIYVVKIDLLMNVQWARTIGGPANEEGRTIRQTSDGGYIIGGYTASYGAGGEDGVLLRLNSAGQVQWMRTYGGPGNDRINQLQITSDGGYIVTGYTANGFGNRDAFLMRLNNAPTPAITWSKVYGGPLADEGISVAIRNNNWGFAMVGSTASVGAGGTDGYLVVTDLNGNSGCNEDILVFSESNHSPTVSGTAARIQGFNSANITLVNNTPNYNSNCICTDYSNVVISGQPLVCTGASGNQYSIPSLNLSPNITWNLTNATQNFLQGDTLIDVDFTNQNAQLIVNAAWTGCTQTAIDTIQVIIGDIAVSISGDDTSCAGDGITLLANLVGGTGLVTYTWNDGSNQTQLQDNPTQNQTYFVTVSDSLNCSASDTIQVTVFPYPIVNLGADTTICVLPSQVLLDAGNPGATYLWSDSSSNSTVVADPPGLWWVNVTSNNCTTRDSISVIYMDPPQVSVTGPASICIGESAQFNVVVNGGTAPFLYSWNIGGTGTSVTVSPGSDLTIWADVTDQNNCSGSDTVLLQVFDFPVVNLGGDTTICSDPPFVLNAQNPGSSFTWSTGTTNATLPVSETGLYYVDVNSNGCVTRDSIFITFDSLPNIVLPQNPVICGNSTILLDVGNPGAVYNWSTGDTSQFVVISQVGIYWVSVSKCNVTVTDTIEVFGGYDPDRIYIPTAFKPESQWEENREFKIYYSFPGINLNEEFEFLVFNRWGQVVKRFNSADDSWNGTVGSGTKDAPPAVYAWRMEIRNACFKDRVRRTGRVTLIR
jgi:hypothetical protein